MVTKYSSVAVRALGVIQSIFLLGAVGPPSYNRIQCERPLKHPSLAARAPRLTHITAQHRTTAQKEKKKILKEEHSHRVVDSSLAHSPQPISGARHPNGSRRRRAFPKAYDCGVHNKKSHDWFSVGLRPIDAASRAVRLNAAPALLTWTVFVILNTISTRFSII